MFFLHSRWFKSFRKNDEEVKKKLLECSSRDLIEITESSSEELTGAEFPRLRFVEIHRALIALQFA